MRIRLLLCFIAIALSASISAVSADRLSKGVGGIKDVKSGSTNQISSINKSYRSPGKLHKAFIPANDSEALARAIGNGAIEIADYGSFKLLALDESALNRSEEIDQASLSGFTKSGALESNNTLEVRDDLNLLLLRSGAIDTTDPDSPGKFTGMGKQGLTAASRASAANPPDDDVNRGADQLRLVQFI